MNADGSARRRFPVATAMAAPMKWSDDGKWLAYIAPDLTTLMVLDAATGATRNVFSTLPDAFRDYTWRSDSKSLVVVTRTYAGDRDQIYEARLDGQRRKLRDIGADLPGFIAGGFVSDRALLVGNPSGKGDLHMVPVSNGAPRVFPRGAATNAWFGVSPDGLQLAFLSQTSRGHVTSLALTSADGSSQRTVTLPFEADNQRNFSPPFTPDGRQVALVGKRQGDSLSSIFLVPINGDPPREVVRLSGDLGYGRLGISPDGKSLVFASLGERVSTIFELELRPLLEAIRKP
jgi:Tol biopolymer transport system component